MNMSSKLVTKAAREVLKPMGLFQAGASRTWIDDHGWFFTVVAFKAGAWSQGAHLNIGMSFLWEQGTSFTEVLPFNILGRDVRGHAHYQENDEEFYLKMLSVAGIAKEITEEYRRYSGADLPQMKSIMPSPQPYVNDAWKDAFCQGSSFKKFIFAIQPNTSD